MTDTPSCAPPPARRLRSRLAAGGLALLAGGAGLGLADTAPAGAASTSVTIGGETIAIDNLSKYSSATVQSLAKKADNSMATQSPSTNPGARGQMNVGDRIVVTDGGLYWLDIVDRGGLLSGMWALKSSGSSADFANYAKPGWSPNYLLPGSGGDALVHPFDTGQYVSVIPTGGSDGSCDAPVGKRKFVISRSNLCGKDLPPASTAQPTVSGNSYTFTGTLYEAGTGATEMVDERNQAAKVGYELTYRFSSPAVRTELVLTPNSPIDLTTVVVGGVSDYGSSPYLPKAYSVSNRDRVHFTDNGATCGPTKDILALAVAKLCIASSDKFESTNFVITNTDDYRYIGVKTNGALRPGDYVTQRQNKDSKASQRQVTYTVPSAAGFRVPQSIDHVWNGASKVVALDADFVNSKNVPTSADVPFKGAFDITMAGR